MKETPQTPDARERAFQLFGFGHLLPANSSEAGHRRTAYFYRKQAIAWARHHREGLFAIFGNTTTCLGFAKSYLQRYRELKGAAR